MLSDAQARLLSFGPALAAAVTAIVRRANRPWMMGFTVGLLLQRAPRLPGRGQRVNTAPMDAQTNGTRDGAISRARAIFDEGSYLRTLRQLVAVPTESQMPERRGELYRYCGEVLGPVLAGMGFATEVLDNPRPGRGPVLLARMGDDTTKPTVLLYGHGDVV